ncbi:MAG: hypothetical protein E6I82_07925 [Chloroflexi bacterium]|nr:MAG: hypothetical protein E6I82_07925 [Chloroflexota bacterium]
MPVLTYACTSFRKAFSWLVHAFVSPREAEAAAAFSFAVRLFFCPALSEGRFWTKAAMAFSAWAVVRTVTFAVAVPTPPSSSVTVNVTVYVPAAS